MADKLCQLASDWRGDLPDGGAMFEQKIDGWRACYFRDWEGVPRLWTRNGMPIEGAEHILYYLARLEGVAGERLFIDGEFQVDGSLAATKRWCERGWKAGGEAGQFFAFDCLPENEWRAGGGDRPLIERKAMLTRYMAAAGTDDWDWRPGSCGRDDALPPIVLLEDGWAFDADDVIAETRRVWGKGGEGVMLKDAQAPYRRNRCSAWRKVKQANAHKWMRAAA